MFIYSFKKNVTLHYEKRWIMAIQIRRDMDIRQWEPPRALASSPWREAHAQLVEIQPQDAQQGSPLAREDRPHHAPEGIYRLVQSHQPVYVVNTQKRHGASEISSALRALFNFSIFQYFNFSIFYLGTEIHGFFKDTALKKARLAARWEWLH